MAPQYVGVGCILILIIADTSGVIMSKKRRRKQKGTDTSRCTWHFTNGITNSLDYVFQLAVRMRELGLPWTS